MDRHTILPDLDGDMVCGYESGNKFRARAEGSMWSSLQQIQHLETQAVVMKDVKKVPREPERWTLANEMLKVVKKKVVKGVRDEAKALQKDYDIDVSGKQWAKKVMDLF